MSGQTSRRLALALLGTLVLVLSADPGRAAVLREESVNASGTSSPLTLPAIQGGTSQGYALFVAKPYTYAVTGVTGGGMSWTKQVDQCSGDAGRKIQIWVASGSPSGPFQVNVYYLLNGQQIAAVLTRYSGVGSAEDYSGANTNGDSGACSGGPSNNRPELTLTSTKNGSIHVVGTHTDDRDVLVYNLEYDEIGSSETQPDTKLHVYDRPLNVAATDTFWAEFQDNRNWATAGVVINPTGGGSALTISSEHHQTFGVGDPPTTISPITVTDASPTPSITAANDLRITIPSGFNMVWDSSRAGAVLSGGASSKVSGSVTYEDSDRTVVLDVTESFAAGDSLAISGLAFKSFSAASGADDLELDINDNGNADAVDQKTIEIAWKFPGNIRSIGTETGVLYSTGTATILGGSSTIDFTGASLPDHIGPGDKVTIAGNVFHIRQKNSASQVTVQETAAGPLIDNAYTIERAYNSIAAWETARQGDLVAEGRLEIGMLYDDGDFKLPAGIEISGSTTDATHYMWLTVAEGQRHSGLAGDGVLLDGQNLFTAPLIKIMDEFTRIEWLQMTNFRMNHPAIRVHNSPSGSYSSLSNLIIHDFYSSGNGGLNLSGEYQTVYNTVIYDGNIGIEIASGGEAVIANCTIYGMTDRGVDLSSGDVLIGNTIALESGNFDFDLADQISFFGYNMYSTYTGFDPASYQGNNQSPPADLEDLFVSILAPMEDFHLEESGHSALDTGLDVSNLFTDDIDGESRTTPWDIGADERGTAPPIVTISSLANQIFNIGDVPAAISPITITDSAPNPSITAANDIRIRIPDTFNMVWDNSDVTASISGSADSKVSSTVAFEDSDRTVRIPVSADFEAGDEITISGLFFKSFTGPSAADRLEVDIDNDTVADAEDSKTKRIRSEVPNYRSIGTETNVLYSDGTASVAQGSSTVTFNGGAALPAHVGVGDQLTVDAQVFYILSRDSATQVTTQETSPSPFTDVSYSIRRAYNTLQDWEAAREGDLVGEDRIEVGVAYDDGDFKMSTQLNIRGSITDSEHYMKLTVAEGQRHSGIPGDGVLLDAEGGFSSPMIKIEDEFTQVEWLQVTNFHVNNAGVYVHSSPPGDDSTVSNVLIYDFSSSGSGGLSITGERVKVRNVMIFRGNLGIYVGSDVDPMIENCTIYGMTDRGLYNQSGNPTIRNSIIVGSANYDIDNNDGFTYFGFNMFSTVEGFDPNSYQGNNQPPPGDLDDLFVSVTPLFEDLHLEESGHDALDTGLNLSNSFSYDVDNETRSGAWDLGADEIRVPPLPVMSSVSDQVFEIEDPPTAMSPLTITDTSPDPMITTTGDLRVRIPASFHMTWDSSDLTATISGDAASKVSTSVTYEDDDQTLVIDVTEDFEALESITISGLHFTSFSDASDADNLELDIDDDDVGDTEDLKTKRIREGISIYRSIGTETGVLYSTGLATIQQGSRTVEFSGAGLPDHVGVGDKLTIAGNVFYILAKSSSSRVTVHDPAVGPLIDNAYTIERAYNSLQDWENGREGDLVFDDRLEVGVAYDDGDFKLPGQFQVRGSVTDSEHYMKLTVAEGQRHSGIPGDGVLVDAQGLVSNQVIRIEDEFFQLEWIQLKNFYGNQPGVYFHSSPPGDNSTASNLLIYDFGSNGHGAVEVNAQRVSVRNTIIFRGDMGIHVMSGAEATIENCTIYGMTYRGVYDQFGTVAIRNNVVVGSEGTDFYLVPGTINYFGSNMYSTHFNPQVHEYQGNDQTPPADLEDLFISLFTGLEDLHLEPTGHDALDTGLDLSNSFTDDIDAETRSGLWDMGADEVEPAAPPLTMASVSNQVFNIGDLPASMSPITITDASASPTITAANDLRIRIPSSFNMVWENLDREVTLSGGAASKVSTSVTYEDSDQTLVLDVTSDFEAGDSVMISGLSFRDFAAASPADSLELDVDNDDVTDAEDAKTKRIRSGTPNYRSIGVDSSVLYSVGLATILQGSTTITFTGTSLPDHVGVGDKVTIAGNEFHILTRDSPTQVTVQEAAIGPLINNTYTIERAFNTLQAWETAREGDLVAEDRIEVGVAYDDGDFKLSAQFKISGSVTDSEHYMKLTVAEGQRHSGVRGDGVLVDAQGGFSNQVIRIEDEFTQIEWLQITNWSGNSPGLYFHDSPPADYSTASNIVIWDFPTTNSQGGIQNKADHVTIRNSIVFDGDLGIAAWGGTTIENCTIYGMWNRGVYGIYSSDVIVRNTISVGNYYSDFDLTGEVSYFGYNMYSAAYGFNPGSYQGHNQSPPADLEDLFVSTMNGVEDLHLDPSGHNAIDTGINLSGFFTQDVDGETRTIDWDMGADEVEPPPPYLSISSVANQVFFVGDVPRLISPITITDDAETASITALGDLRITIPDGLNMIWDSEDLVATLSGAAASKVSKGVEYEDNDKTLVLDVRRDFDAGDSVTITGLYLKDFTAESYADSLELDIDDDDVTDVEDDKTKRVRSRVPNYRSIGIETNPLYSTGHASVAQGSSTITFSDGASLPTNIGVGDWLRIDGWKDFYILSRDSDTQVTVQTASDTPFTDVSYSIKRAYNDIQSWETARQGDLVAENRTEIGVVYDDGDFTPVNAAKISGSTTDSEHYMRLTVAEGHRHEGVRGAGVMIDASGLAFEAAIHVEDEWTQIEWVQIAHGPMNVSGIYLDNSPPADDSSISKVLVWDYYSSSGGGVNLAAKRGAVRNSMLWDGNTGIKISGDDNKVENCTIYGMNFNYGMSGRAISAEYADDIIVRNTIAVGSGEVDIYLKGTPITYFGYNMYETVLWFDPDDYQGHNQSPPANLEDLFISTQAEAEDLHLELGNHYALGTGLDLSGFFTDDVDGNPRASSNCSSWDLGADEASGGLGLCHFNIEHDGWAVNCQAEEVTIEVHDVAHNIIATYVDTVDFSTSTGHGDWSLVSGEGELTNLGLGEATYTFALEDAGVVVVALRDTYVETISIDLSDGELFEHPQEDPDLTYLRSGFQFLADGAKSAIGPQLPGKRSNVDPGAQRIEVEAIRTNDETGACEAALQGDYPIDVAFECVNPTTCGSADLQVSGLPVTGTDYGQVLSYTTLDLNFGDATDTTAELNLNYPDVGKIKIHASYTLLPSGEQMLGASNEVVYRPFGFLVTVPGNPGAADADGAIFTTAGTDFTVNVTAVIYDQSDDADSDGVPDGHGDRYPANDADLSDNTVAAQYGRETPVESVALTSALVFPNGGNDPGVGGLYTINSFDAGVGTTENAFYDEVGIVRIDAVVSDSNYLGIGASETAKSLGSSGYIGRFIPAEFQVSYNAPLFATGCGAGSFTYLGETFGYATAPVLTATAKSAQDNTTLNYTGDFVKLTNTSLTGRAYSGATGVLDTSGLPGTGSDPAIADNGDGSVDLTFSSGTGLFFQRGDPMNAFNAEIALGLNVIDSDGVAYASNPATFGFALPGLGMNFDVSKEMRYGRLAIRNVHGSELLDLFMPLLTQYYTGSVFVTNVGDSCTSLGLSDLVLSPTPGDLVTTPTIGNSPLLSGDADLSFRATGAGNEGYFDVEFDLSTGTGAGLPWLQFDWDGDSAHDDNPTGRATFGVYRGNDAVIMVRELY